MKHIWSGLFLASIMTICLALTAAAADVPSAKLTVTPSDDGSQYTISVSADAAIGSIQFTLPGEYSGSVEIATIGYDEESHSDDTFAYIGFSTVNDTFIAAGTADGLTETEILTFEGDEIGSAEDLLTNVEIGGLDGLTKFDTTVTGGGAGIEPEVDNRTSAVNGAKVTFEDGGATAVVECDKACVVLAEKADGSYERLPAVKRDDNTYTFDLSGISGEFKLVVALKGDADLNGQILANDVTMVKAAQLKKVKLNPAAMMAVDVNGDGQLLANEVTMIKAAQLKKVKLAW